MIITLNRKKETGDLVLHLLHYIPEYRGGGVEAVHDRIPLYKIDVLLRVPHPVKALSTVPQGGALSFASSYDAAFGEYLIQCTIPEVKGHQMVEVTLQ